jgi:hypothetical protein
MRIRVEDKQIVAESSMDGRFWEIIHRVNRSQYAGSPEAVRVGKMAGEGKNADHHVLGPHGACEVKDLRVMGGKP